MPVLRILIAGEGRRIFFLACDFISQGHQVTIVTPDAAGGKTLSRRLKALVIVGDPSNPDVLREAGAEDMSVVLAISPRDEDNLVICQSALRLFGVARTVALVNDPEMVDVFHRLGVTRAFTLTHLLATTIERRVETQSVLNLVPLDEGGVNLTEIVLEAPSPVVGKTLAEVRLPVGGLVACIIREGRPVIPGGDTRLEAGDRLTVLTQPDNHAAVIRVLTGEGRRA